MGFYHLRRTISVVRLFLSAGLLWMAACAPGAENAFVGGPPPALTKEATSSAPQLLVLAGTVGQLATVDGVGAEARFSRLFGVTSSADGDMFMIEDLAVRKVTQSGVVTTVAELPVYGFDPPDFPDPRGVAVDSDQSVFVANNNVYTVDKIDSDGTITRVLGTLFRTDGPDRLNHPEGLAVDADDNLYIADTWNDRVLKLEPNGTMTVLPEPPGGFLHPRAVAVNADGDILVADTESFTIRKIAPNGVVSTVAGAAGESGHRDGVGAFARFTEPAALAVAPTGHIYVVDGTTVREITPSGEVRTIVGVQGESELKLGPLPAGLHRPSGVAVLPTGELVITERSKNVVLIVSMEGSDCSVAVRCEGDRVVTSEAELLSLQDCGSIDGSLTVENTVATDLGALECLGSVTGSLSINGNAKLEDLRALENLVSVGDGLRVTGNDLLSPCEIEALATRLGVGCDCVDNGSEPFPSCGNPPGHVLADFPACTPAELESTLSDACSLAERSIPLRAGTFDGDVPAPRIEVGQVYGVRLQAVDGQNEGVVTFVAPRTDEYLVYLGTPNVPFLKDSTAPTCSRYLSERRVEEITGGVCGNLRGAYLFPITIQNSEVRIRLGRISPQRWVRLLVMRRKQFE